MMHRGRLAREDPAVGCGKPLRHGLLVPFFVRTHPLFSVPPRHADSGMVTSWSTQLSPQLQLIQGQILLVTANPTNEVALQ